jgi:two-component system, OmpR family, response regulator ArlR
MQILVVDDDIKLNKLICDELKDIGYEPDPVYTADKAIENIKTKNYMLAIVDWEFNNEEKDGTDIIREIYKKSKTCKKGRIPILMLTGKSALADKVAGLEAGADDYLVKPFYLPELTARIKALQRREKEKIVSGRKFSIGPLSIDPDDYTATLNKKRINLRKKEFKILQVFMEANGKLTTRQVLGETIWGKEGVLVSNSIDVHMKSLRDKLQKHGKDVCIETIRGIGYRLNVKDC